MNLYHAFLLEVAGRPEGSTFSHLMRIGHGKYKNIVQDCINKGLIEAGSKNSLNEDLYFISEKGKRFLDNPKGELL